MIQSWSSSLFTNEYSDFWSFANSFDGWFKGLQQLNIASRSFELVIRIYCIWIVQSLVVVGIIYCLPILCILS